MLFASSIARRHVEQGRLFYLNRNFVVGTGFLPLDNSPVKTESVHRHVWQGFCDWLEVNGHDVSLYRVTLSAILHFHVLQTNCCHLHSLKRHNGS